MKGNYQEKKKQTQLFLLKPQNYVESFLYICPKVTSHAGKHNFIQPIA